MYRNSRLLTIVHINTTRIVHESCSLVAFKLNAATKSKICETEHPCVPEHHGPHESEMLARQFYRELVHWHSAKKIHIHVASSSITRCARSQWKLIVGAF